MKAALFLSFLVALVAAEQQHGAWKPNMEYRYQVKTQTLAAIPNLKNQWVGLFTKADLTIRPISKDVLIGKLQNGKYSEWHDELPKGPTHQPEKELSYQSMEMNTETFEVRLRNGAIHSIAVEKDMTNVQLNQLKSIISQLQVDVQARNLINDKYNYLPHNKDQKNADDHNQQALYKVMEPTVTGKCETTYDLSRVPLYLAQAYPDYDSAMPLEKHEHFYELFKTKNYSNCEQRMGYHFGVNGFNDWTPNSNVMGSLSKSAVSRVVITGSFDKYTIRSSTTTNRIVKANPDKENRHDSEVFSQVNLTLVSMVENNGAPQKPSKQLVDTGNLVYSYDSPSDAKNLIRQRHDSSEEVDASEYTGLLSNYEQNEQDKYDEQADEAYDVDERRQQQRNNKYARKYNHISKNDDDKHRDNDKESRKQYQQPKPTLKNAPENPLYAYFIHGSNDFNGPVEVQKLTEEIVEDLQKPHEIPVKYTLRKFNVLAKILRTMSAEQIEEATRKIEQHDQQNKHEKCLRVYTDALATAGTGPAVNELMTLIEQRKIDGETAAELIFTLPKTIRLPTEEMQQRFFDFVKNDAVKNQAIVNTTAGFAFTRFLYIAQVHQKESKKYYPVDTYGPMSDRDNEYVSKEVIPYFVKQLERAVKENDAPKVLYAIRALGNLGHQDVPKAFEPYLSGKERITDFQRLAIVLALDRYAVVYPQSARNIFFQMYQNKGETHEIRALSVFLMMSTSPSADLLQRLAEETNTEENNDVRAAVRSAIESAAALKDPKHAELARSAKSAEHLLKKEEQGIQYSRTYLRDYAIAQMEATYETQYGYLNGKDSFIPNGVYLHALSKIGGFQHKAEFQAIVSSIDELVHALRENVTDDDDDQLNGQQQQQQSKWSAENIMKMLNMKPNQAKQLEGQILVKLMDHERFIAFDKHTLKQMVHSVKEMARELRNGKDIKYTKFFNQEDVTISFPLETGMPFVFVHRKPTLVQVNGKVMARSTPDIVDDLRVPEKMNLDAEIDAVYAVNNEISLSFINPSTRQRYTVGHDKKAQINVPLRVESEIDLVKREIKTEFKPLYTDKPTKFLQMGSWPYTTRDSVMDIRPTPESKHTKDIHSRPVRESRYTIGKKETGFAVVIVATQEKDSDLLTNVLNQLRKQGMASMAMLGQEAYSPRHYSINLYLDAAQSASQSTKITLNYNSEERNQQQQQQQQQKQHPRARGQSADGSDLFAFPESTTPNSQNRREQFMRNAAEGLDAPTTANVLDIAVEFKGNKDIAYIATIAGASSKSNGKSRILSFAQKLDVDSTKKSVIVQIDAKHHTVDRHDKPHAEYKIKAAFTLENEIELVTLEGKVEMKQSEKLQEYLKQQSRRQTAEEINENAIDEIDAEWELKAYEAVFKQLAASKWYNYLRYLSSQYLSEQIETNDDKSMFKVAARLTPEMESVSIELRAPGQTMRWNGVPLPKMTKYIAAVPTSWNWKEEVKRIAMQKRDSCDIYDNEINTFESRTVKHAKLDNTWHLAVHKMHEHAEHKHQEHEHKHEHYVSVLVRDAKKSDNENHQNKEALIVLHLNDEKDITLRLSPSAQQGQKDAIPRFHVDEIEQELRPKTTFEVLSKKDSKMTLARVFLVKAIEKHSSEPKYVVRVETEISQLLVKYDEERLTIRSKSMSRNNRGICGAYTGQKTNDLKSPDNKIMRNDQEYVDSWAIVDESNAQSVDVTQRMRFGLLKAQNRIQLAQQRIQQRIQQAAYPHEEVLYSNPIPNKYRSQRRYNNDHTKTDEDDEEMMEERKPYSSNNSGRSMKLGTKHQTQYVEDQNRQRICFTKRPLPSCQRGTKANGKIVQDVEVVCRGIEDTAAQQYKLQIQRGRNLDLSSYKSNANLKFNVPKRCEQA